MRIILTDHTKQRMPLRDVTLGMIRRTLDFPDERGVGYNGRQLAFRKWEGKILKVVYVREGKASIVVISVIWHDR